VRKSLALEFEAVWPLGKTAPTALRSLVHSL